MRIPLTARRVGGPLLGAAAGYGAYYFVSCSGGG